MDIEAWLSELKRAWSSHDIDALLSLFAEDVEYWETPHKQLMSFEDIRSEWQGVTSQKDIQITTTVYASIDDKHTIIWDLQYVDPGNVKRVWSGTYLITLNNNGLCIYFHHTGEKL